MFGRACLGNLSQHRPLMHGNVIGLVTLDFELWSILTGAARIDFEFRIARVDLDYPAGYIPSLGIPADVIANFKVFARVPCACARTRMEVL